MQVFLFKETKDDGIFIWPGLYLVASGLCGLCTEHRISK